MGFDFSPLPPEILSGLMYTGPGSGPLMQAASAWSGLAEELTTTATSIQSQVSGLGGTWEGPAAAASTAAINPYVGWMEATAAQAAQMASQATTAAGLFETAHAATVPPPVVAANRALLLALIATNFFGQNTPSIMATEAQYEAMWGQDVAAAQSYSAASESNNSALPKTTAPPNAGNGPSAPVNTGEGAANQAVNQVAHAAASQPTAANDGSAWWNALLGDGGSSAVPPTDPTGGLDASAFQSMYYPLMMASIPARMLPSLLMQLARMGSMGAMGSAAGLAGQTAGAGGTGALMGQIGDFVNDKMQGAVGTLVGHFNSATQTISAKLGQAASMGSLKVPQGWSAAADGMVRAAPVLPTTTVSAPMAAAASPGGMGGMPGGPFGNALMGALAGRGIGSVAAKAPKVVPRSPAGG